MSWVDVGGAEITAGGSAQITDAMGDWGGYYIRAPSEQAQAGIICIPKAATIWPGGRSLSNGFHHYDSDERNQSGTPGRLLQLCQSRPIIVAVFAVHLLEPRELLSVSPQDELDSNVIGRWRKGEAPSEDENNMGGSEGINLIIICAYATYSNSCYLQMKALSNICLVSGSLQIIISPAPVPGRKFGVTNASRLLPRPWDHEIDFSMAMGEIPIHHEQILPILKTGMHVILAAARNNQYDVSGRAINQANRTRSETDPRGVGEAVARGITTRPKSNVPRGCGLTSVENYPWSKIWHTNEHLMIGPSQSRPAAPYVGTTSHAYAGTLGSLAVE
ncbi:hypothetical protein B0H13DRAFT_1875595 [Mycena leptocephala]|nr:hypothetical protein B0H13DRAFT_1875595 [Mycena leptocephala]